VVSSCLVSAQRLTSNLWPLALSLALLLALLLALALAQPKRKLART